MGLKNFIFNLEKSSFILNILHFIPLWVNYLIVKNNFVYIFISHTFLKSVISFVINSTFLNMKILQDIIVVDYPDQIKRFKVVYSLCSYLYNFRLFIVLFLKELQKVSTLIYFYSASN